MLASSPDWLCARLVPLGALDFIGVSFDPACLECHKNRRAIATPSAEQMRRPINREGVDYWRHSEPWLGPLTEALGPALESWDR